MKKYVLLSIAFALLIVSFVLPSDILHPDITAGPGNGENLAVNTPQELSQILKYISNRKETGEFLDQSPTSVLLSADGTELTQKKNISVTFQEDTSLESSVTQATGSSFMRMNRRLICYMTEDASYYISKGSVRASTESVTDPDASEENSFIFDLQIYTDSEITLIKFKEFKSNELSIREEAIAGRWVQLPTEFANAIFTMVDGQNRSFLRTMGAYLEDEALKQEDDVYTLSQEDPLSGSESKFTVNLSDPEEPFVELVIDADANDSRTYLYDTLSFKNIDNTVIDMNITDILVIETEEDFEKYFDIRED